jgi:CO/xanthine dehydrogenase FAD-binding subunit
MSDELIGKAAEAAVQGAAPLGHNAYKIPLVRALVRRALRTLAEGLGLRPRHARHPADPVSR